MHRLHFDPRTRVRSLSLLLAAAVLAGASPSSAQSPPCQIYGPESGCGAVVLCGPGGEYRWEWFGPDGAVFSTSRCVEARTTGLYGLIVTGPTGMRSERCQQFVTVSAAPPCLIAGPARVCAGETARLCGPDGGFEYAWSGPAGFSASTRCIEVAEAGRYTLDLRRPGEEDCASSCVHDLAVENCVRNLPPDCSAAKPSVAMLWPPDHEFVPVSVLGVTDPDGDPVRVQVTSVTQNEPVEGLGDGDRSPDARVEGDRVFLRAERGMGTGRVYEVAFTARDGQGGESHGVVRVCVPRRGSASECASLGGTRFSSFDSPSARRAGSRFPGRR